MATPGRKTGFDCDFVEKPQKAFQSECPVCLQVLHEPYQVSCCGYSFCHACINRIKKDNKPCPTCNEENFVTFHDKRLQRSLYEFQVYCSHKEKGCDWKGELGQLDNHLNLSGDCPMAVVDCDFRHVGCDVSLPRKDMPTHLKENLVTHMSLQAASYSKLLASHSEILVTCKELQASHKSLLASHSEIQDKVRKLERENETLKQHVSIPTAGCVELTLENFEQHKKDKDDWFSPPFYTGPGGYKLCLSVNANGKSCGRGKGTHVSVWFFLMRGEFDDHLKWPFRGDITVQLVDQEGGKKHCTETIHFTDQTPGEYASRVTKGEIQTQCLGRHQFISHGELKPDYLKNDCLRFRITKITPPN